MPRFGVARKYAEDLPRFIAKLRKENIDAYEMGFAYGIPSSFPEKVLETAKECNVYLTAHLPLWINLGNHESNGTDVGRLVSGIRVVENMQTTAVFHLGWYGGKKFSKIKDYILKSIREAVVASGIKYANLGIETTGKSKAIGTLEEILELLELIDSKKVTPVIDWSHLYARHNGQFPYSYDDFRTILEDVEERIGYKPFHFHGGGVKYKNGSEIKHLSVKSFDPPLPHLLAALKDLGYADFTFIVESPTSIEDVQWLKKVWASPREYFDEVPSKGERTLS